MKIELAYGNDKLKVEISDRNLLYLAASKPIKAVKNPADVLLSSIENPISSVPLKEKIKDKKKICIVISDVTRAVPTKFILKILLGKLGSYRVKKDYITILVATGLHRPNLGQELEDLIGKDILQQYRVINHIAKDLESCRFIGKTKRGIPIIINKFFLESDFKILTGLIEPHFMAGFSGGRKAVCPGISYMDMFKHFHGPAILESSKASVGVLERNPFHEESTEIAKKAGVDFIINVTINKNKEITGIFCGDLEAAFYAGAKCCMEASSFVIKEEADIVITTGGGLPLDATLYQAVKGMVGAIPAVKKGGMIIIASECNEKIGSPEFVEILENEPDLDEFIKKIKSKDYFKIDQWEFEELIKARRKAEIYLYSGCILPGSSKIPPATLKLVSSVEEAIKIGLAKYGNDARITVIPEGPYVIPIL